jgi:hypothetical protein
VHDESTIHEYVPTAILAESVKGSLVAPKTHAKGSFIRELYLSYSPRWTFPDVPFEEDFRYAL